MSIINNNGPSINYQLPEIPQFVPNISFYPNTPPKVNFQSNNYYRDYLGNQFSNYKNSNIFDQPKKGGFVDARRLGSGAISTATDTLLSKVNDNLFGDSEVGRNVGAIFSSGISSAGNTMSNNIMKGVGLSEGLSRNVGMSVAGTASGVAANYIGKGISELGGNSALSRGIGQGVATGLGSVGGTVLSNLISTGSAAGNAGQLFARTANAAKWANKLSNAAKNAKTAADAAKYADAANTYGKLSTSINPYGLAGQVIGTGLQAALGPSKEYQGKYGNITKGMDTAYDLVQSAVGFIPGYGQIIAGAMALNKGLSNVFGSTSGMTRQDAILGSAFMPAPVKWLNMAGAKTTDTFHNQSWQNTEKTDSFMQNGFGNLHDVFAKAREEAGKTYGTFSRNAYNKAANRLNTANSAWNTILDMANQNLYQNIRAFDMSSINNQRYAQNIQGGWSPLARGKQGMKILNNATNHNIGMRLLSAAALIDNKQMILCSAVD